MPTKQKTFHTRYAQVAKAAKASAVKTPHLRYLPKNHFRMRRLRRIPWRSLRLERSGCENPPDLDASALPVAPVDVELFSFLDKYRC